MGAKENNCLHKKSPTPTGSVWNANIAAVSLFWNKHQHGCLDITWKRSKVVYYMAERWSESHLLTGYPSLLGISCVGPATKSSFFGHMKDQARNVWRGTQTTRRHFCLLFFVEHSLKWIFFRYLFDHYNKWIANFMPRNAYLHMD